MGFPGGSEVKTLPASARDADWSLGLEDPLKKEMATHTSVLAWEIPLTEEPCGLQSQSCKRVGHNLATKQQQQTKYSHQGCCQSTNMSSLNTELACAKFALGSLHQHFTELPSNERTNLNSESAIEEKGEGEMDQYNFGQRTGKTSLKNTSTETWRMHRHDQGKETACWQARRKGREEERKACLRKA